MTWEAIPVVTKKESESEEDIISEEPSGGMEIPLYLQGNYASVAWGDTTLAKSGCGPTCLAMVMSYLTGDTSNPAGYDCMVWNYIPCTNPEAHGNFFQQRQRIMEWDTGVSTIRPVS